MSTETDDLEEDIPPTLQNGEVVSGEVIEPATDLVADDEAPDPGDITLEPYTTPKQARRKQRQLIQAEARLERDYVIWVLRGGPKLCGYSTAAAAISDIKQVAKSQAYREVALANIAQSLAEASGQQGERGISSILEIEGLNAKAAESLKRHVPAMVGEIERQALTASSQDEVILRIVPDVVRQFVSEATKKPSKPDKDTDESGEEDGAGETASSTDGDEINPDREMEACPVCHGTGSVPKTS